MLQRMQEAQLRAQSQAAAPFCSPARGARGFRSMLLLTPKSQEEEWPDCPHYCSPKTLPDLEPLLRKYSQE
jgi:hypothetical protein